MSFQIDDTLHGTICFDEPVFFDLINSEPMQRIRDIDMGAYSHGFHPGAWFSRFEHSLGVGYLLRLGGASIAEQIHGVLHDINHTIFSHAIDYVLQEGSEADQSYQDDTYDDFFMSSGLPAILEQHGFDTAYIIDDNNFLLEERPLPELCADRIDYAARSLYHYGLMDVSDVQSLIGSLKSDRDRWFFLNRSAAERFAEAFAALNEQIFSSFKAGVMYRSIGDCVGHALKANVLSRDDLLTTDHVVLDKVESASKSDKHLRELWERMNGRIRAVPSDADGALDVRCKSRIVDPLFQDADRQLVRLSDVDQSWKSFVQEEMKPKRYRFLFEAGPVS